MSTRLGRGFVEFFLKSDRFNAGAKTVVAMLGRMKNAMQAVAGIARNILFAGAGAAIGLIKLAQKQIDAEAKLAAVIKATGGAAGFTAKELIKQAAALQKLTTFGDDAIINGQAILATFKEIKGDIFKEAVEAMLDMSTVMDGDLKGAAVQLGKALNDPILGISALARVGVSFTEKQKESIKQFVAQNDVMSAQRLILKELQSEFGGTAAAMAKTDIGKFRQAMNQMSDAGERFGKVLIRQLVLLIPHMEKLSRWVSKLTKQDIEDFIEKAKTLGKVLLGVWLAPKLIGGMIGFVNLAKMMKTAAMGLNTAFRGLAAGGVAALAAAWTYAIIQGQKLISISNRIQSASLDEADAYTELARLKKELAAETDDKKRLAIGQEIEAVQKRIVELMQEADVASRDIKDTTSTMGVMGNIINRLGNLSGIPTDIVRKPKAGVDVGSRELQLNLAQKNLGETQKQMVSLQEQLGISAASAAANDRSAVALEEANKIAALQLAEQQKITAAVNRNQGGIGISNNP